MNILISGAGIAGLTLAFWLSRGGHEITLVEKSPALRDEGYMIDFFGSGYDVAEKMDLLPDLGQIHCPISRLVFIDAYGRAKFSVSYAAFRRLFDGRHYNFMRGDLERVLYTRVKDNVQVRFGTTVKSFQEQDTCVRVSLSDATVDKFDLLVGADGVHSHVRHLAFGPEGQFTRFMGYYTAAFILRDRFSEFIADDALYTLNALGRQVAVYPAPGEKLATFFVYKARHAVYDFSPANAARELGAVYKDLDWIVPTLLSNLDQPGLYFDEVSQVVLPRWHVGRVVLIGDAAYCVSLLAGQGASMAMAGAYILAEELGRLGDDISTAFWHYEERLRPGIERRQQVGRRLGSWFVPETRLQQAVNDLFTRMVEWPVVWRLVRRALVPESIIHSGP